MPLSFSNPLLTEQFDEQGFVLLKGVATEEVALLHAFIHSRNIRYEGDFYYSLLSHTYDDNLLIQQNIRQILQQFYAAWFRNYTVRNESFLVKPCNTGNELMLHQDWSYTDISKFTTGTAWLPLSAVGEKNGTLILLPRSHSCFNQYISGSIPTLRMPSSAVPQTMLIKPELQPGDVVVFNPAVFHGSSPNLSGSDRIVVTATVFPREAPFIYAHKLASGAIARVALEDDAFLKSLAQFSVGDVPAEKISGIIRDAQPDLSEAEFRDRFLRLVAPH